LIAKTQIACRTIRWLPQVEAGDDANLFSQALERLLFPTGLVPAFNITASGFADLERTSKTHFLSLKKAAARLKTLFRAATIKIFYILVVTKHINFLIK
jgi:hypothetical protein